MTALINNDVELLREISRFYYKTNGIYQKIVNYFASMYRYDWYMVPEILNDKANNDKIVDEFMKTLNYFDATHIKKLCGEFALSVIRDGIYYCYAYEGAHSILFQELPWKWCRSRYKIAGVPAIEFDMSFFDTKFLDVGYRMRVLDLFPQEFKEGYILYKKGKLPPDDILTDGVKGKGRWYLLKPGCAF